jgi:REP-associated tyrosine transposase
MGRGLRNEDPTVIYHAVSRGNNRAPIVWDTVDRESLTGELGRAATKFDWEVYAWCAMSTHHHVVLRAPKGGLSLGFQQINGNHARRTNIRHGRVGHLFQNRFFAATVTSTVHLVAAVLYVARNPVSAGLCRNAAAWPESSYRATAGLAAAPDWLAVDRVLGLFGSERKEARAAYARLVHHGHLPVSDTIEEVARVEPWPLERGVARTG